MATPSPPAKFTHFFDLPQEVRDMIYMYWPKVAWIDVAQTYPQQHNTLTLTLDRQHDKSVNQPNVSKVCHRMRTEALDVFYGNNKFMLDLRGWKHAAFPKRWTPPMIFEHWIDAIGDRNCGRLRSLSFVSHEFKAHVKMGLSSETQHISLKFRLQLDRPEMAENVPSGYTFHVAAKRAQAGLRGVLDGIEAGKQGKPLDVADIKLICRTVQAIQPFLCKRSNLGSQGAILPPGDVGKWPRTEAHQDKCDDCGYHRYTRGAD